jgi:hypothetical protein
MTTAAPPRLQPYVMAAASPMVLASMVKIRTKRGIRPLRLWPHQRRLLEACLTPGIREITVLKSRQTGVTQDCALYCLHRSFKIAGSHCLIVSKGEREAKEAAGRVEQMYGSLPQVVRDAFPVIHKNIEVFQTGHPALAGMEGLSCDIRNLPSGAGRSYAADVLIADEFDHWEDPVSRMADLEPAVADDGGLTIVPSTANGYGGAMHSRWLKAKANPHAVAIFVSALDRPGRTLEWVMAERERLEHLGPQEYPLTPEEAFVSTGSGAFDPDRLTWQGENFVIPGTRYEFTDRQAIRKESGSWVVWEAAARGRRYLVTGDPSGGGPASDPSAAAVYDIASGAQVAAFHGRVLPHQFSRELAYAGVLFNGALLAPELNNHGQAVIAHLLHMGYARIYEHERFDAPVGAPGRGKRLGWLTSNKSKNTAVNAMRTALRERTIAIRDAEALEEMMRFAEVAPGIFEARSGHDDRVIAHIIAAAIMQHSTVAGGAGYDQPVAAPSAPYWRTSDVRAGY